MSLVTKLRFVPTTNEKKGSDCGTGAGGFSPGNTCAKTKKRVFSKKPTDLKAGDRFIDPETGKVRVATPPVMDFGHTGEVQVPTSTGNVITIDYRKHKKVTLIPASNKSGQPPGSFPEDIKVVKNLGGSTGAQLVEDPSTGKQYIMKKGANPGHLKNEHLTNEAYRKAGVLVPDSTFYLNGHNGEATTLSEFVEGTQLGNLKGKKLEAATKKLQEDFAVDAVLANWDVVGSGGDNLLVDEKGNVWRIDNGGAMKYRAQGAEKGSLWGEEANEINTMRTSSKNPAAKKYFGPMTDDEVLASVNKHNTHLEFTGHLPNSEAVKIGKRLNSAKSLLSKNKKKEVPTPKASGPKSIKGMKSLQSSSGKDMFSQDGLASYLSTKATSGTGFNNTFLEKAKYINPNGIKDGVFLVPNGPASMTQKRLNRLKQVLPPGTELKVVITPPVSQLEKGKSLGKFLESAQADGKFFKASGATPVPAFGGGTSPSVKPAPAPKVSKLVNPGVKADTFPGSKTQEFGTLGPKGVETGGKIALVSNTSKVDKSQASKEFITNLSADERNAVKSWKGSARGFRKRQEKKEVTEKDIHLRNAIKKAPKYEGTVFRGFTDGNDKFAQETWSKLEKMGVGTIWTEHTPMCTSRNAATGKSFSGGTFLMKIKMTAAAYVGANEGYSNEDEVIGYPGAYYRITRMIKDATIDSKKVKYYVEMEQVSE